MPHLRFALPVAFALALIGCKPKDVTDPNSGTPGGAAKTLAEARKGYATKLTKFHRADRAVPEPPANVFRKITYKAVTDKYAAYVTPDPKDGKKRPAIVWITGGDCNTIGDVWSRAQPSNDQTARQYRDAGIVMMFPSLRGGNMNSGAQEGFYGEVDDVLAAAEYLAQLDYVDPDRVYLGGHSTGGTLVMLVAAMPNRFRAAFSFGPADNITNYPDQFVESVNLDDPREVELRSPGRWLHSIQCPTFVFEGDRQGNTASLDAMAKANTNPKAKFFTVRGATHFSLLAPTNALIAQKITADTGGETNIGFTEAELSGR